MIEGASPFFQALLGTLLTWGLTALGASAVFFLPKAQRSVLDASLGFASGIMIAASFWSLLAPAIEMAEQSGAYGLEGEYACIPTTIGFLFGALFVYCADVVMTKFNINSKEDSFDSYAHNKKNEEASQYISSNCRNILLDDVLNSNMLFDKTPTSVTVDLREVKHRKNAKTYSSSLQKIKDDGTANSISYNQWKRILLMIVAVTVHNIPEGLAVGVGFAAIGKTSSATFNKAKNLAIGIGIQNFPEGMAVSLPLRASGYSLLSSFWWGQLSGMVEPVAGILGAVAVGVCEPLLPYALSFAAGAMIFVVVDDIIPEAQTGGNGRLASFWAIGGFMTMMVLDVALG